MQKLYFSILTIFLSSQIFAQSYNHVWSSPYGGIGEDVVRAMSVDDEGNTYTTGYFTDFADFDPGDGETILTANGFYDIFVQKIDADGNLVWAKSMGGPFFDYGTGIETDAEGNVYVTGVFQETVDFDPSEETFELVSNGAEDIFVLKLDTDGNFVWAGSMGGPAYEEATSIGIDENGGIYVSGYFNEPGDYDPGILEYTLTSNGGQDAFVVKLTPEGGLAWARSYGGPDQVISLGMDVAPNGDIFLTGMYSGTANFDPTGNSNQERTANSDGHDSYVLKLNSLGEFFYVAVFGGSQGDTSWDVAIDNDGNAYAAGGFQDTFVYGLESLTSEDNEDVFVVKVDAFGNINWARGIHGTDFQNAYDVNTDPSGNVLIAGYFNGTADFDPSEEEDMSMTKESTEPFDAFFAVFNTDGNYVYAAQFGGSNFTDHHGIDSDLDGNLYLAAAFQNTVDLNPNPDQTDESSVVAFRDSYVIKMEPITVGLLQVEPLKAIAVYPNPARDNIELTLSASAQNPEYFIFDVRGAQVLSGNISAPMGKVDVSELPAGTYVVMVAGHQPAKWIKH